MPPQPGIFTDHHIPSTSGTTPPQGSYGAQGPPRQYQAYTYGPPPEEKKVGRGHHHHHHHHHHHPPSQHYAAGGGGHLSETESVGTSVNGAGRTGRSRRSRTTTTNSHAASSASGRWRDGTTTALTHKMYMDKRERFAAAARILLSDASQSPAYTLEMYPHALTRAAMLSAIEMEEQLAMESMENSWNEERLKVEEEWRKGKDRLKERLLEGIEERRKKAREEKESDGLLADPPTFDAPPTMRAPKKSGKQAPFVLTAPHPFGAAGEEMVSPFPMPLTALGGGGTWGGGRKRQKGVGQAGGIALGKAIATINGLKEIEIENDMSELKKGMKRKRARAGVIH